MTIGRRLILLVNYSRHAHIAGLHGFLSHVLDEFNHMHINSFRVFMCSVARFFQTLLKCSVNMLSLESCWPSLQCHYTYS